MSNEAPNSNSTMRITNNVRLTTMCAQQFSMIVIMQNSILVATHGKANLWETRVNDMKQEMFVRMEINFEIMKAKH